MFTASRRIYSLKTNKRNKANGVVQVVIYNVFCQDSKRHLRQLPRNELDKDILSADGAALKLDHQKNGWKGVCVYQEHTPFHPFFW